VSLGGPSDRLIGFKDFVHGKTEPYDDHGQGTHVAATNAADDVVSSGPGNTDRLIGFKDFVHGKTEPYDDHGQGTHVAATNATDDVSQWEGYILS
jgi:subtilisin family serine protease